MYATLASIPSPSSGKLGPFNAYGLMIALGVMAAIWLAGKRLTAKGVGTSDDASSIGLWGAFGGILGARLYHVATSWDSKYSNPLNILKVWEGGLGIPGGILGGVVFGLWAAKRRGLSMSATLGACAPCLPLGQAIGRWGNWWNQELFGRPTTKSWGLEIDDRHIPVEYPSGTLFHPTFLYESLGNLAVCGLLLWIDKRFRLKPGRLMAWYLILYWTLRFFVEGLRIDPTKSGGGLRLNQWVGLVVIAGSVLFLLWSRTRQWPQTRQPADEANGDPDGHLDSAAGDADDRFAAGDTGDADSDADLDPDPVSELDPDGPDADPRGRESGGSGRSAAEDY